MSPTSVATRFDYHDAPHVLKNAQLPKDSPQRWADDETVPLDELRSRLVWRCGKLVPFGTVGRFDDFGKPLNPHKALESDKWGRHSLGKWGVNHAADPIVTADPALPGCPIRLLAVVRGDCGRLALPGGMVDGGETFSAAAERELFEEAVDSSSTLRDALKTRAAVVYTGPVEDPRNTNNAWIETVAVHVHLSAEEAAALHLRPASDGETRAALWMDVSDSTLGLLYADHERLVRCATTSAKLPVAPSRFPRRTDLTVKTPEEPPRRRRVLLRLLAALVASVLCVRTIRTVHVVTVPPHPTPVAKSSCGVPRWTRETGA